MTLLVLSEVMHGGSSALGLAYLALFGAGSIAGMLAMTTLISLPLIYTATFFERTHAAVCLLAGATSVVFGVFYGLTAIVRF